MKKIKKDKLETCWRCNGSKTIYTGMDEYDDYGSIKTCPVCKGKGKAKPRSKTTR